MPEVDPAVVEPDQPRVLRRLERFGGEAERHDPCHDPVDVTRAAHRRDQQRQPRALRELLGPTGKGALDGRAHRKGVSEGRRAGELLRGQHPRQLDQRERVSPGRLVQQVGDLGRDLDVPPAPEQDRRRFACEARRHDRFDARRLEGSFLPVAGRAEERNAIRAEPPDRELQRILRRAVEPLCVVDDDEQRPHLGRGGEESEGRGPDREPVVRVGLGETERSTQRLGLMLRELLDPVLEGPAELDEPRVLELCLRLDPGRPDDRHLVRPADRVPEQRRLADARLSADHECPCTPLSSIVQQFHDPGLLGGSLEEHPSNATRR